MMSQEGQIQSELMESMRAKIQTALDAQSVSVSDVQGDGRHVEIVVVSNQFEGQNSVNRQRMVYKAIWEELQDVVHAVRPTDAPLVASHVLSVTPRSHHPRSHHPRSHHRPRPHILRSTRWSARPPTNSRINNSVYYIQ